MHDDELAEAHAEALEAGEGHHRHAARARDAARAVRGLQELAAAE